jgi:hypothetical protein
LKLLSSHTLDQELSSRIGIAVRKGFRSKKWVYSPRIVKQSLIMAFKVRLLSK